MAPEKTMAMGQQGQGSNLLSLNSRGEGDSGLVPPEGRQREPAASLCLGFGTCCDLPFGCLPMPS